MAQRRFSVTVLVILRRAPVASRPANSIRTRDLRWRSSRLRRTLTTIVRVRRAFTVAVLEPSSSALRPLRSRRSESLPLQRFGLHAADAHADHAAVDGQPRGQRDELLLA